eukprot:Plantae.Rhodophyta-Hildenbrandia_rubra.ctg10332.p1 GENE.Plantae.Rhodophyta-Hildenbrandia_rubra.ctg10332~~Plantae.Rhodophyta-Hildenbrandia_rubra.ctg10332.p1  ORF type:complete len:528 (+),score=93.42 Plantae.Rhodophyta-Hildenbrandia_rubra.ctg10332:106-1584(+)
MSVQPFLYRLARSCHRWPPLRPNPAWNNKRLVLNPGYRTLSAVPNPLESEKKRPQSVHDGIKDENKSIIKPPPISPIPPPSQQASGDETTGVQPFEARTNVTKAEEGLARELVLSPLALCVTREYEWGNILLGFEQANRYTIRAAPSGECVGYIAEKDSLGKSVGRNVFRTHRGFEALVLNREGIPVFKIRRPMYLVSTSLFVETPDGGEVLGEVIMKWHVYRRRYELFVDKKQFANVDSGFLAFDFAMKDEQGNTLGSVNKDFTGFAREIFTDAGQYVLRLDPSVEVTAEELVSGGSSSASSNLNGQKLGMRERAVMLGCAISIDFDYFSQHSRRGGMGLMPFFWPGGSGAGGGAAAGEVGQVGAAGAAGAAGGDVTGAYGIGEEMKNAADSSDEQYDRTDAGGLDSPQTEQVDEPGWDNRENEWTSGGSEEDPYGNPSSEEIWKPKDDAWDDPWKSDDAVGDDAGGDDEGGGGITGLIGSIFRGFTDSDD